MKYGCEYGGKRPPVPLQELKIWVQGHKALRVRNVSAPEGYMVRRHTKRLISDAYGRGVARGAVEASNLAVHFKEDQCLDAESMRTADSTSFPGHAFLRRLEFVLAEEGAEATRAYAALDPRDPRRRKLKVRDIEFFYGHRGVHPAVRYASAHEFVRCWEVVLARYPRTLEEDAVPSSRFHATLTEAGRRMLHLCRKQRRRALRAPSSDPGWTTKCERILPRPRVGCRFRRRDAPPPSVTPG